MRSPLLEAMGLGSFDIAWLFLILFVITIVFVALFVVLFVQFNALKKKYQKFTKGKDGKSLEKDIIGLFEDNRFIKNQNEMIQNDIQEVQKRLRHCYQKMGLVKYDAFHQMGGQLSFCVCLLDERDTGFLINSVHSTEGCYSYTKEIQRGECSLSLGDEEQKALNMALGA